MSRVVIETLCQNVFWSSGINHSRSVVDFSHLIPKEERKNPHMQCATVTTHSTCSHNNNADDEWLDYNCDHDLNLSVLITSRWRGSCFTLSLSCAGRVLGDTLRPAAGERRRHRLRWVSFQCTPGAKQLQQAYRPAESASYQQKKINTYSMWVQFIFSTEETVTVWTTISDWIYEHAYL